MTDNASPMGCLRDAQAALQGHLRVLGTGGFRIVYVDDRDRFVYKVTRYEEERSTNEKEHQASLAARASGVRGVPRTYLWRVGGVPVLCMRKYPRPTREKAMQVYNSAEYMAWRDAGFGDIHDYNVTTTPSGRPRIIDMQFYHEVA